MFKYISLLVLILFQSAFCLAEDAVEAEAAKAETPKQAISSIIKLYETEDFETLIKTRYAEISKAKDEGQVQSLIDKFKNAYSDKNKLKLAVSIYKSTLDLEPEMSDNGNVAKFMMKNNFIKLSRMDNGKWGFHL